MFKKLKDKIADEVKANPRLQVREVDPFCPKTFISFSCREPWTLLTRLQLRLTRILTRKDLAPESLWPRCPLSSASTPWQPRRPVTICWPTGRPAPPPPPTSWAAPAAAPSSRWARTMTRWASATPPAPPRLRPRPRAAQVRSVTSVMSVHMMCDTPVTRAWWLRLYSDLCPLISPGPASLDWLLLLQCEVWLCLRLRASSHYCHWWRVCVRCEYWLWHLTWSVSRPPAPQETSGYQWSTSNLSLPTQVT